jgi:multidrug resistance efflux pump
MTIALLAPLSFAGRILAADAKPDCSAKQKDFDESKTATKATKADLSSCKDKKSKEKMDCEKPLKDKAKEDMKAAQDKMKTAKKALECCNNPKMKGCAT